eukprot:TRINITY_DN9945_c0_g1_i1.p1 TRINITY_DN9945_c0_g1~~TRINITY_DN9945_c0_g1_i1.p1  ORF type:complete len:435 (+),score=34.92 TRINITY_DN9945_c0_g1_i1:24-1328(+)
MRLQRHRLQFIGFCCVANAISYADRVNLSLAIVAVSSEYNWPDHVQGEVLAAFFYGYICTQLLGGVLAVRYTGRLVLVVGMALWSLMTLLTPPTASLFALFVACRVALGLGEGVSLPAIHDIAARWFPAEQRSRSVAFVTSGQYLGTIAGLLSAPLVERDWRVIFYIFGALGLVWIPPFLFVTPSGRTPNKYESLDGPEPTQSEGNEQSHLKGTEGNALDAPDQQDWGNWRSYIPFLTRRGAWAIYAAHFGNNWGFYLLISWLPKYFVSLGLGISTAGFYGCLPYIGCWLGSNSGGWIADHLRARGTRLVTVRRLVSTVALLGPAIFFLLIIVCEVRSAWLAALLLAGSAYCAATSHAGFLSNILDVAPRHAAPLLGVSNTIATIPGIAGNLITGWVLEWTDGNWDAVFGMAIGTYLITWTIFVICATADEIFP